MKPEVLLRRLWMRFVAGESRAFYNSDAPRLERAYRLRDPWAMDCAVEQHRFSELNRLIREHCGESPSALELGAGEGHHTARLLECCEAVDGLELSARAVARAQARGLPRARFFQTCLPAVPSGLRTSYDLVIASEVFYYLKDIEATLALMDRYGKTCIVSFFRPQAARLDPYFEGIPGVLRMSIAAGPVVWECRLWRPRR